MKKKLAIIRADDAQMPFIEKAREMGIETHCFSWDKEGAVFCKPFADYFHPISILEKEQILEKCKEIKIDGVVSKSDNAVPTVAFVAQGIGIPGNNYEDALIMSNKYKARIAFFKNGVNSPNFTIAKEGEDIDIKEIKFPVIVKPTDRSASIGIKKVDNETELQEAIQRAQKLSFAREALIEEFITGSEATLDMITFQGKHYPIIISDTETTGAPYFTKIGYHQPSLLNPEIQEKIIVEAKKALTALKFNNGASDTEVIVTKSGEVKVIEINPRMGGDATEHLVRLSTGYDFAKGALKLAIGQFEVPEFPLKKYSGVCFLGKETEYLKSIIENKENDPEIIIAKIEKKELKYLQCGVDRSGYLIYQSDRKRSWK